MVISMSLNIRGCKMKKFCYIGLICSFVFLFVGCTSTRLQDSVLNGLIYDSYNEPVSNASIYINDVKMTTSDVYGHFMISNLTSSYSYELKVCKQGYEDVVIRFEYENISQLAYVKLNSYKYLLEQAEYKVSEKNYDAALQLLDRVDVIDSNNPSSQYLRSIVCYRMGEFGKAISILNRMEVNNKQPFVYLLLADCYEYGLRDFVNAKLNLEKYLNFVYSKEVEERCNRL